MPHPSLRSTVAMLVAVLLGVGVTTLSAGPASAAVNAVRLTLIADGVAPFDTLDGGASNGRVRTNDVVSYGWSYTSDNTATTSAITFVQKLNAPAAVRFDQSNLAQCTAAAGSISSDGQTLTCPVRVDASGSGLVPITLTVPSSLPNGTTIGSTMTADDGVLNGGSQSLTVVGAPQYNLKANLFGTYTAASPGGVVGQGYTYSFVVTSPAGVKGNEVLASPMTFTANLSTISNDASLVPGSCRPSNRGDYGLPFGKIGITANATAANSVIDSGTISCAQSGRTVTVTITDADLSAASVPTRLANGGTPPIADNYLVSGLFTVFVPNTDITGSSGIQTTLQYRDFDPTSVTGQSNYGADHEPGGAPGAAACTYTTTNATRSNDNCFSTVYGGRVAGYDGAFWSNDVAFDRYVNGKLVAKAGVPAGDGSSTDAGNGVVSVGEEFWTRLQVGSTTGPALTGAGVCDKWDPAQSRITRPGNVYRTVAGSSTITPAGDYTVQYGVLPMTTDAERRSTSCGAGSWYDSVADAGGPSVVNAVRFLPKWTINNGAYDFFYVGFEAVENPIGTIIGHFNSARLGAEETWGPSYYNKVTNNPTYTGDRLTLSNGRIRVAQTNDLGTGQYVGAGSTYTYTLSPTVTNAAPTFGAVANVVLLDTLPACVAYVPGSSSVPLEYVAGSNGNDGIPCTGDTGETGATLRIPLGSVTPNTTIAPITFKATALRIDPDSTSARNTVVISSDAAVPVDLTRRTATTTVSIRNQAQFAASMTTSAAQVAPGDDVSFTLAYRNVTGLTLGRVRLITELPAVDDVTGSAFTGTARLSRIAKTPAGATVECTSDPHGTITTDPETSTNTWSSTCGATTTAIRLTATNLANTAVDALVFTLATSGNAVGDRYVVQADGDFTVGTATTKVPATERARVDVTTSSIAGQVWLDRNGDGLRGTEPDYPAFPVKLTGTDDQGAAVSRTTTTSSAGTYRFTGLRPGSYKVTFDPTALPNGLEFSPQGVGENRSTDSDGDPTTGVTATIALTFGVAKTGIDQGIRNAAPKVTLTRSAATVPFGTAVALTATLNPADTTGTVVFRGAVTSGPFAGSTVTLGSAEVDGAGRAVLTTPMPAYGLTTVTAEFSGNATRPGAASNPVTVETDGSATRLLVSEFRLSGPSGPTDQFVELTNAGTLDIPLPGVSVRTAAGTTVTLAKTAGSLAPGRSYLIAAAGYSLGQTATAPDLNIATLGASTGGVRVSVPDTASTVTDAVGAVTGYSTGTRLAALTGSPTAQYGWVRLAQTGVLQNTGDNAADFLLVSTTAAAVGGVASAPGTPAPTGTAGPIARSTVLRSALFTTTASQLKPPNREYVAGTPGRLTIRRTITNTTSAPVTAMRIRINSLSEINGAPKPGTAPQPADPARLRLIAPTSPTSEITVNGTPQTVVNLTPDAPAGSALGLNSTMSVPLPSALAPGASIPVAFSFAVDGGKTFWFSYAVEA